jgi:hypothetical protein
VHAGSPVQLELGLLSPGLLGAGLAVRLEDRSGLGQRVRAKIEDGDLDSGVPLWQVFLSGRRASDAMRLGQPLSNLQSID